MLAIGIDLGGTNLRWCVVDGSGEIRHRGRRPSPKPVPQVVAALREAVAECREHFPEVAGVGLAVAGTVTEESVSSVNLDWQEVPLARELALGDLPVIVENDMNAGAYGEMRFGGGRGLQNLIFLTVSTGIGAGIIVGGRIYRGANGLAGEVGHTVVDLNGLLCGCGRRGCIEALASRTAIERDIFGEIRGGRSSVITGLVDPDSGLITSGHLAQALQEQDPVVTDVLERAAYHLGIFTGSLVNVLDTECVVYGGGLIEACGEFMLPIIRETAYRHLIRPVSPDKLPILEAALGDNATVIGSAMLASVERLGNGS